MSEHQASRTLVKSPPELWAECSDARSLARHLGEAVGEIQIRRLEPETTVAWEGDRISGTVRLEPSGWGTKVTLTADAEAVEVVEPPAPTPVREPAPAPVAEPARLGLVARWRRWFGRDMAVAVPAPEPVAPPEPPPAPPEPEQPASPAANRVDLTAALESLGKAHHRPFSRA
jgi:hypothetical protein